MRVKRRLLPRGGGYVWDIGANVHELETPTRFAHSLLVFGGAGAWGGDHTRGRG